MFHYNHMTTKLVLSSLPHMTELQRQFLHAVDNFAYEATFDLEGPLGECAGDRYDREKLIEQTKMSIQAISRNRSRRACFARDFLYHAVATKEIGDLSMDKIESIVDEEAVRVINLTSYIKNGKEVSGILNGHHARQLVAANSAESVALHMLKVA